MKKNILLFIALFVSSIGLAQPDLSLPHLWQVGQQNSINPASSQDSTYYINIPDIALQFRYSGLSYSEVVQEQGGEKIVDVDQAIAQLLPTDNQVYTDFKVQSYRLMYNTPQWSIQQHQSTRFYANFSYPKSLAQLVWQGNAPFIGQSLAIGPSFEVLSYQETGIGGSYQFGKVRLGATFKFLAGIGVAKSNRNSATISTSDDIYQLQLETDYEMVTADYEDNNDFVNFGIVNLDFSDISLLSFGLPDFDLNIQNAFFSIRNAGNRGMAIDLGMTYQHNKEWTFGLSVLDIGRIKWKNDGVRYQSQETTDFNGINIGRVDFANNETLFSVDDLRDTLEQVVNFTQQSTTFKTTLPVQSYFNAHYQYNAQWDFGLALYGRFADKNTFAASLGANYKVMDQIRLGAVFAMQENNDFAIGLNATLRLGPVQVYGITQNIFTVFRPLNANQQGARVGLALIF